jgi:hypothetical protein
VEGLVWLNNHDSYAGSSIVTGRASHTRQVKCDDPNQEGYPVPPGWGLGHEAKNLTSIKASLLRSLMMDTRWIILVEDQGKGIRVMSSILLPGMYSCLCKARMLKQVKK